MMKENSSNRISSHQLIENWFRWCIDSTGGKKINAMHAALYFYMIHRRNHLGSFDNIPIESKEIISEAKIIDHQTYFETLNDLMELGFLKEVGTENSFNPKILSLEYSENLLKEIQHINSQDDIN